jgi:hypothetical protein
MKIVYYNPEKSLFIAKGGRALVFPYDHPNCSNTQVALTSMVTKVLPDGQFFTENSHYVPASSFPTDKCQPADQR